MKNELAKKIIIYQAKNGAIEFRGDFSHGTVWANLNQLAKLFGRDKSVISRHIKNVIKSGELNQLSTVAKFATVQKENKRSVSRLIEYYNLDMILSVGYRVDSKQATLFRIWANKIIKQYLETGYVINKKIVSQNYLNFMLAVSDIKILVPDSNTIQTKKILDLIEVFANTWFSLEAFDKSKLPIIGENKDEIEVSFKEVQLVISQLKTTLLNKNEATDLFALEINPGSIENIIANVFQSAFGADAYQTREEKAAHLLYFIVKNHPFIDGNKRSGAFVFVWFLSKIALLSPGITSQTLTTLTLLVAISDPKAKDKMIRLILQLIREK